MWGRGSESFSACLTCVKLIVRLVPVRRTLVTGGAGFIGSALVRLLGERGDTVRVFDNLSTGSAANLEGTEAELVEGDVRDAGRPRARSHRL